MKGELGSGTGPEAGRTALKVEDSALPERYRRGLVRRLDLDLWEMVRDACSEIRVLHARELLSRAGERLETSALLLDGLMARYVRSAKGGATDRAIVSISVPGDFVDLHGLPLKRLDHDIGALTEARVAFFPHDALHRIMDKSSDNARQLWRMTMIDAAMHRHWIFRTSRLRALASVADFISEMDMRLQEADVVEGDRLPLPLLQTDIAEIAGISAVHVSRVCKDLRESGTCTIRGGYAEIHDRARLHRLARFDPSYLYPFDE